MSRKSKYRAVSVKKVNLEVLQELADGPVTIGLDVAKDEVFAVVRDSEREHLRPWKAKQATELQALIGLFLEVRKTHPIVVGLESTGTYGDAIRQAMTDAEIDVQRVSGKAKADYEEIFDGVPSAHDGKDAAIIAELVALGKSKPWPYVHMSEDQSHAKGCVAWLNAQQDIYLTWLGRIEATLARHWPEATKVMDLSSFTLLQALAHYGGPTRLAEDPNAAQRIRGWGGNFLTEKKVRKLCESAQKTAGVRMNQEDCQQLQRFAEQALAARKEINTTKKQLQEICKHNEVLQILASIVGSATACVLYVSLGDPRNYHCGAAYRKAMGLNLMEHSSGRHKGRLKITKRGPSAARRWLYFAALRLVQKPELRGWYEAKKQNDRGFGSKAIVAVMRKLAVAIWHVVVHGVPFDLRRLFPGKPLLDMGALPPNPRDLSHSC
jgi:transposase